MEPNQKDRRAFLALGANRDSHLGPPEATIRHALGLLDGGETRLAAVSRFFRSAAFPAGSGPDYVNLVTEITTELQPDDLLLHLHRIEAGCGRVRAERWGARTLDLDLLAAGDRIAPDRETLAHWIGLDPQAQARLAPDRLILPHPRLQDRAFVLIPWSDIAPLWRHPLTGRTVAEMLAALPEAARAEVRPL
ncbi:MAG: 2-amino-4-hydroxy-6-hydroxymethyldihydropteridine diphosphokinase [Proteobacteria bacterium]|nr:2-amino-4-hydroxy-6-hydroxymethyldihydropteridine diphosphokinase [Pseudomonadota bacterium]MBS0574552.1 2-amino-4-hydroxy-6-hydroxymethyldihydropteridine diphosphokinase [Pseudomonadota bacterium]